MDRSVSVSVGVVFGLTLPPLSSGMEDESPLRLESTPGTQTSAVRGGFPLFRMLHMDSKISVKFSIMLDINTDSSTQKLLLYCQSEAEFNHSSSGQSVFCKLIFQYLFFTYTKVQYLSKYSVTLTVAVFP